MAVKSPPIKSPFEPLRFPDGPISPDMLRQNFDRIKAWAQGLAVHIQTNYVALPTASTPATVDDDTPSFFGDPGVAMGGSGEDGQDGLTVPGSKGAAGSIGAPGPANVPLFADDGSDGMDGFVPGPAGAAGATGAPGAATVPLWQDGEDGADGMTIPGAAGAAGATGATGPATVPLWQDGEDGADALPIPGPTGQTGAVGAPGPTGLHIWGNDGEDGNDAFVKGANGIQGGTGAPGSAGAPGPTGLHIWGNDGEDGGDAWVRGATGQSNIGPPGAAGSPVQGPDGEDGADAFVRGPIGSIGPTGPTGPTGATGLSASTHKWSVNSSITGGMLSNAQSVIVPGDTGAIPTGAGVYSGPGGTSVPSILVAANASVGGPTYYVSTRTYTAAIVSVFMMNATVSVANGANVRFSLYYTALTNTAGSFVLLTSFDTGAMNIGTNAQLFGATLSAFSMPGASFFLVTAHRTDVASTSVLQPLQFSATVEFNV